MYQLSTSLEQSLGLGFEASGLTRVSLNGSGDLLYVVSDDPRPEHLLLIQPDGHQQYVRLPFSIDAESISFNPLDSTLLILDEGSFANNRPARLLTLALDHQGQVILDGGVARVLRIQEIPFGLPLSSNGYEAIVLDTVASKLYVGEQDSGRIQVFSFQNGILGPRLLYLETGFNDLTDLTLFNLADGSQALAALHGNATILNGVTLGSGRAYLQILDPAHGTQLADLTLSGQFKDLEGLTVAGGEILFCDDAGPTSAGNLVAVSLQSVLGAVTAMVLPPSINWQLVAADPADNLSLWVDPDSGLAAIQNGSNPRQIISRNDSYWSGDIPLTRGKATLIAISRDESNRIRVLDQGSSGYYGWILDNNAHFIGETAYSATTLQNAEQTFSVDLNGDGLINGIAVVPPTTPPTPPLINWQLVAADPADNLSLWVDPDSGLAAIQNGSNPRQIISRNDSYWSGDIPLTRGKATLIAISRDESNRIRVLDQGSSGYYGWILDNNAHFIGETAYSATTLQNAEQTFSVDLNGDGLINGIVVVPPTTPPPTREVLANQIQELINKGSLRIVDPATEAIPRSADGAALLPKLAEGFNQAVPSNDWWSSVVFPAFGDPFSAPLYAHPLTVQLNAKGLSIGSQVDQQAFRTSSTTWESITPFHHQLQVQILRDESDGFELIRYGDWSFTGGWRQNEGDPELTLAQASPIAWINDTLAADISINWQGDLRVEALDGNVARLSINGDDYAIYSSDGSWILENSSLKLSQSASDIVDLAIALLPAQATTETKTAFDRLALNPIIDTQFQFSAGDDPFSIALSYNYETSTEEGSSGTLFALYPHLQSFTQSDVTTTGSYSTPRGSMTLQQGSILSAEIPAMGILPMLPVSLTAGERDQLRTLILSDSEITNPKVYLDRFRDTYWSGKALLKTMQSAQLAKYIGEDALANKLVTAVTDTLDDWFYASGQTGDRHFSYNPVWDTVQGYPDSFGSASQLNDHHFHYGYFIHAAALAGLFDPGWAQSQQTMVDLLINDVAGWNLSDASLPELRNFSAMAGHAWASGHGAFGRGNNQESSSESMNFYTGLTLWGSITERSEMAQLGQTLYSLEAQAIQQYWFDHEATTYPDGFDVESVGMIWGDGAAHATWFSAEPEHIKGINFLPFTGGSLYLSEMARDPSAFFEEVDLLTGGRIDQWGALMLQYQALVDPHGALIREDELIGQLEEGQSGAGVYSWIHTLSKLGSPTSEIRADHPLGAVFVNTDTISYSAFNPGNANLPVLFSDGYTMNIAPGTLQTNTVGVDGISNQAFHTFL